MRKFLFVILTSLATLGAHAWEPTTADVQPEEALVQPSYAEALVTIAPVPMPATVVELARYSPKNTSIGQAKKAKAAKVAARSMLSRSAREQIALARTSAKPDDHERLNASDDEDADTGLDELDLHRSFSQPKVAKTTKQLDDDDAADELPAHIKLRLLMARTKAVEAYILSQAGKEADSTELSDSVKLRLSAARAKAMQAHSEKFGAA